MRLSLFCAIGALALAACAPKPDEQAMSECWTTEAKNQLISLTKESVQRQMAVAWANAGTPLNADAKAEIESSVKVTAEHFYVKNVDRLSDAVHCGANVSVSVEKDHGQLDQMGPTSVSFDIYHAEQGQMYTLASSPPVLP